MKNFPLMLYDDKCTSCVFFAKAANRMTGGKLKMIGHYTNVGKDIRVHIPHPDPTSMFWIIEKDDMYAGRAALIKLIQYVFLKRHDRYKNIFQESACDDRCDVMLRSCSVIRNSAHIKSSLPAF